ncbi:MAG: 4Fe-4S dicluster domain-containing protein [Syntrophomonadaceae bacterium]
MDKQLIINSELCTGCGACEMACAINKTGQCAPGMARINVWREETRGMFVPLTCMQCVNPPCVEACLMNIIYKHVASGITLRHLDQCIGCRTCQIVCPFEGCRYDYQNDVVVNCDLCGGQPECVKYCPTGALSYNNVELTVDANRFDRVVTTINTTIAAR